MPAPHLAVNHQPAQAPRRVRLLAAFAVMLLGGIPAAAGPLPMGPARITMDVGLPLEVFTYKPPTYQNGPLIVVFHGVQRNAEDYRNFAITLAERFGAIVVAPLFDKPRFPVDAYQRGGIMKDGQVQPPEAWTFALVPKLVDRLRADEGRPDLPYYYIGHSAGGQFLVRMVALTGAQGARRVVATNPGSHLFPNRDANYGYGFGGLPGNLADDEAIRRYLAAPLTLYLGTNDIDPNHPSMDRSPEAMVQGRTRYERGLACHAAAQKLAAERGWPCNWRLVETSSVEHDAARMFASPAVEAALFGADEK
jgi:poly(3-hydroxybutyrate) depolymerase